MNELYTLNTPLKPESNNALIADNDYILLFNNMISGFAVHEIIVDDNNNPIDYRYIAVNPEFEKITGLKAGDIIGRRIKEIMPEIEEYWIKEYGKVALTGKPAQFENFSAKLNKHFEVRTYSPGFGKFAVIFFDITDRKNHEDKISHLNLILASIRNVNQLIVQETSKTKLINKTCKLLTDLRGYHHAYIALLDKDSNLIEMASSGND
ncbi:MAG: PAS domain S-box protein [Melioribacteraceae bacterium]|nr:PAS domain S-box protein [Melioribacteraceae bacterium]